ncbi:Tad domain-containing protein [Sphingomonas hankyongi]|uniref:Tad domain-containing protein n=1 Tax=Sphingomonas hankyongi TaxID=2908209 RepID=A0ABT0RY63_9SPHN|nr:Tad domain-containing protein [Sphingomonas hankyongi]MCL6728502.1 Tad domain-containing protein [Sphingomonas hankyongi]
MLPDAYFHGGEMISFFRKLMRDKRGNALVIAGAALPLVIGSAGLASDTIQWTLWKRQLQRGADSAALAGVYDRIYNNGDTGNISTAVNTDLGKNNHVGINLLTGYPQIEYPANTSAYSGAVKVTLKIQKTLGFSSVFLATAPVITATATAATIPTGVYCVVSLEDTAATGITATGNGDINLGCGMITNSVSLTAAIATGSSDVDATPIAAVGDIKESDNWNGAELLPFTVKEEDPFKNVNVPPFTACQGNSNKLSVNANASLDRSALDSNKTVCFSDMNLNGNVTLGSNSIYIIDGGDFSAGAQSHITCNHCTIVLTNSTAGTPVTIGNVTINGGAEMDMSASNSGDFDRILFYQDRRASSSSSAVNKINGNSDSLMTGAFYFPTRQMEINGTAGLNFQCAQFVARNVTFSGNGSVNNSCSGGYGDKTILGRHVRLVA